ncbi:arginyl-tRNA synthetase [Meira miltonrushii]|uniref:arginine--tRNA ligase n=1 Tax=Meira miltonrushii TaxID=1280837 RepID=A0A316VKI6_9BASI|nr:arginyl-tRNA synthetase [Meira miltonrushii]PWN38102.1 arginyl-tRNA synthetase [Meira miltonrushii]
MPAAEAFAGVPLLSQLPELPHIEGADPKRNPLDAFRVAIAEQINKALPEVKLQAAFEAVQTTAKDGDLVVALPRFKLKAKPDELAKKVLEQFKPNAYMESLAHKGVFLNYMLPTTTLTQLTLATIDALSRSAPDANGIRKMSYGTNKSGEGKRMIVEFSSPNIAKPFHAGHLRSTIIGAFLANLYEANGWYVERWNYLGDWGKQFGLLAVAWKKMGSEEELRKDAVTHLYNIYVAINKEAEENPDLHTQARAFFKKMEDGDEEAVGLWRKFRDLSIKKYEQTYARLNIHFDVYSGESQVRKESIQEVVEKLRESPYCEREDNGALLIDLKKYKLEKAIVERSDGTPLYITRDLGEANQRWAKFKEQHGKGFDKMIYVVASQQDLHLGQFFKVLELLGYDYADPKEGRLQHINFGMVLGMSTRKGTAVFLDHILDETKENMHDVMRKNADKYEQIIDKERTADIVGMTAVKIQDMTGRRGNNYNFDWSRMLSFEGDTGPYLQYNHVRLCSVERRVAETDGIELPPSPLDISQLKLDLLTEPKARDLTLLLASWPDTVKTATREQQPSTIVQYCYKLTHAVSSAWEVLIVKGQEKDLALARLFMYRSARHVLNAALRLLTIEPLDRM